ncbi:MAG: hypothetical protein CSYNP_02826 [Syntrophus sp. SKADARSKE-3]|nr:hypothetical protein [Syntrophus sp. SKADARSKE-3]
MGKIETSILKVQTHPVVKDPGVSEPIEIWRRRRRRIWTRMILGLIFIALTFPETSPAWEQCFQSAGEMYSVSPVLLWSMAKIESSFNPRAINRNSNGTYDYGVMQINSSWARTLGRDRWNALGDPCYNIHVGAWILAGCVKNHGYNWTAVGCYNATSPTKRKVYAGKVARALNEAKRLQAKIQTGSDETNLAKNDDQSKINRGHGM